MQAKMNMAIFAGAFIAGLVAGAVAIVYHTAFTPFGLIASLVLLSSLMMGLRLLGGTKTPVWGGALGIMLVMALLAGFDGRGSVLISVGPESLIFVGIVAIALIFAIAWPRLSASPTSYDEESPRQERTAP